MLEKTARLLSLCLNAVAALGLVLLLLHIVIDVVSKYLFRLPIPGTIETVSWYYMVAVAFLPVAYVQMQKRHITVEMFTLGLNDRQTAFLDALVAILALMYVGILFFLVFGRAVESFKLGEVQDVTVFDLPVWPARWFLPLAFGTMTLVLLHQIIVDLTFALFGRGMPTFRLHHQSDPGSGM